MATTTTPNRIGDNNAVTPYVLDPDATTLTAVGWVDMRDFKSFMATLIRTTGTSAMTNFAIHANTDADGGGNDVAVVTKTVTATDAVGDYTSIQCGIEQIMQLAAEDGYDYRYVSLKLQFATGTDDATVTYIQADPRFARSGLTTDYSA